MDNKCVVCGNRTEAEYMAVHERGEVKGQPVINSNGDKVVLCADHVESLLGRFVSYDEHGEHRTESGALFDVEDMQMTFIEWKPITN